ncbi:hypothetical protein Tsubulata_025447, partial [Turnera subulata]
SGRREALMDVVPVVWGDVLLLSKSGSAARSPLLRKHLVKLAQRIGFTCLPHRLPTWCYVVSIHHFGNSYVLEVENLEDSANCILMASLALSIGQNQFIWRERFSMRAQRIVRWSAAKGIGRITSRLTSALADEALSSVLELFSPGEGDGSWHGACLPLAELAHRGLLLPTSLPRVVPFIVKALHYDIRRGPHRVGSLVRDAAAYVCWGFGHAYFHADMRNVLERLGKHLLTVACYDREDKGLGELAAEALSALVKYDPQYFMNHVIETLIPSTLLSDLCKRCGVMLAIGEIILALHQHGCALDSDMQKRVSGIVLAIEKARLYRGKGGEIIELKLDNPEDRDSEARVNAVKALVSVCKTLTQARNGSHTCSGDIDLSLYHLIKNEVMAFLFKALDDYSVDNRGDAGSWVREAAIEGLESCTYLLCTMDSTRKSYGTESGSEISNSVVAENNQPLFFYENLAITLIGGIAKQAVEKMDSIREAAVKVLQRILYNKEIFVPFIAHTEKLEDIVPNVADLKWVPTFSYPQFVELLRFSCYSKPVLSGLVISIGGLQDSLRKASLSALLDYLQVHPVGTEGAYKGMSRTSMLGTDIRWVLQQYRKSDRVVVPTLKVNIFL